MRVTAVFVLVACSLFAQQPFIRTSAPVIALTHVRVN